MNLPVFLGINHNDEDINILVKMNKLIKFMASAFNYSAIFLNGKYYKLFERCLVDNEKNNKRCKI